MRSIGEVLDLFYLRYTVQWYELSQQARVRKMFYSDHRFRQIDKAIRRSPSPYRVPRAFPYGETPLLTLKAIADRCGLSQRDTVLELGCGCGRSVFFLRHYKGCTVKGVDWVPQFVRHAQTVATRFKVEGVSFECKDMRQVDLRNTTFIYLYGTCLDDPFIEQLKESFKQLPRGAKIVTVSYPIEGLKLKDQFTASFPWGEGEVFLQEV